MPADPMHRDGREDLCLYHLCLVLGIAGVAWVRVVSCIQSVAFVWWDGTRQNSVTV
jgi:hypothetical protein